MLLFALLLAATPLDRALELLKKRVEFTEVAVSPDGSRAAWVERAPGKDGPDYTRSVIRVGALGQMTKKISACPAARKFCDEAEIAWSPDGKQLAFLSDGAKKDQQQLYLADLRTGRARPLTKLRGTLHSPRWSPDGKRIAF